MASGEGLECNGVLKTDVGYCNGGPAPLGTFDFQESENVEDKIVQDMDMFLDDIDDRLTISRMVSDSVIKGIVSAISEEAAEVINTKEREVATLSKVFYSRRRDSEFVESEIGILGEVEGSIFGTVVQGLRDEHERRLLDVDNVLAFIDRCKEISSLRHELDSIKKSFVSLTVGLLSPQGSLDADILHRKVVSNHGLHSSVHWDGNGKCDESELSIQETFETSKLTHMSRQELYEHFRTEMINMKRDYESIVHQKTEEYYKLRREFLNETESMKERGHFAARKDKDFDLLTKKMSEVISRLDDILVENKKLSEFCNHSRDTLNNLFSENCRLRELLNSKKLEASYLSQEVSDASVKLAQHLTVEENLQKLVDSLMGSLEDARLEASTTEETYKCIMRELVSQEKPDNGDSDLKSVIVQERVGTIYEEAFHEANIAYESFYGETSDFMSNLMEQVYSIVFQNALEDMSMELNDLKNKCLKNDESVAFLVTKVSKIEKDLQMEVEENGKLKHQTLVLKDIIEDKDKFLDRVTEELHQLVDLRNQHENLIADKDEELFLLKEKLDESHNLVDLYMTEIRKLNDACSVFESRLITSDEENTRIISAFEQKQHELDFVTEKAREHQKQMESFCYIINVLSKSIADLELRTNESIGWHSSRLENSAYQLRSLVPKVNILRRTSLLYKERLEKRCSDLQKAEAEVDALGDEVDTLLGLLEKIYVALDHYSPILEHYPGIIEILKLVKRELSGEAVQVLRPHLFSSSLCPT